MADKEAAQKRREKRHGTHKENTGKEGSQSLHLLSKQEIGKQIVTAKWSSEFTPRKKCTIYVKSQPQCGLFPLDFILPNSASNER